MSAPQPYFDDGQVSLYLGDCRSLLPELGITADLVVADPPYQCTSLTWDRWPDGWLEVAATASRSLWCFGSMRMFGEHWQEFTGAGWKHSQDVVWEKNAGTGFATDRFKRVHESVTHWYRGAWGGVYREVPRVPYSGPDNSRRLKRKQKPTHTGEIGAAGYEQRDTRMAPSVIWARNMNGRAIHPTEKPVEILKPLIEYACPAGGLVVDMFTGSGAALDAARELGRRAVGFEIREEDAEKAARRLSQVTLFSGDAA